MWTPPALPEWAFAGGEANLHQAALTGDPGVIFAVIKTVPDVDINTGAEIRFTATNLRWTGVTPLHLTAWHHPYAEPSKLLLDEGTNVNVKTDTGVTPLHLAVEYNPDPAVVELLLDRGAATNIQNGDGLTPCQLAQAQHRFAGAPLLGRLCSAAAATTPAATTAPTPTPAPAATQTPTPALAPLPTFGASLAQVERLPDQGADINEAAGEANYFPVLRFTPINATALHFAALNNPDPAVVELLPDRGADVDVEDSLGSTPLHFAALNNPNPAVARLLLDRGAEVNAASDVGSTPLFAAASGNPNPDVIEALLDQGADINRKTSGGRTVLDRAVANEFAVIKLLLDRGALYGDKRTRGTTALHRAVLFNTPEVVTLLLDRGGATVDLNTPSNAEMILQMGWRSSTIHFSGGTPLHYAVAPDGGYRRPGDDSTLGGTGRGYKRQGCHCTM